MASSVKSCNHAAWEWVPDKAFLPWSTRCRDLKTVGITCHESFKSISLSTWISGSVTKTTPSSKSALPAPDLVIVTPEKAQTAVKGLEKAGKYSFQLTVTDDKKHVAKDTVR